VHLLLGLLILSTAIGIFTIYSNNSAQHEQFASDLRRANEFNSQLSDLVNQMTSLPSTTTKTRADWKTYYDNQTTSLQSLQTSFSQASFNESAFDYFTNDFKQNLNDYVGYITLEASATDLTFQIQNDTNAISIDNNSVNEQKSIAAIGCTSSCDNSYVDAAKATLSTDTDTLNKDQQSLKDQQSQSATLVSSIGKDNTKVKSDLTNLKYSGN
jgi:hypothetical protein